MEDVERLAVGPWDAVEVVWAGEDERGSADAREYIEQRWAGYLADARAAGRSLFNGPITWLKSWRVAEGRLWLELGATDYKTFLVTVLRNREWFLWSAPDAMRPGLGNSVLLTRGDRGGEALLGVRSAKVAAYPGRGHLFGGVLDYLRDKERNQSGLVGHVHKELQEELGMGTHEVGAARPLGLYRDSFLGQPELVWQMESSVGWDELAGRMDREEHDGLRVVGADGVGGAGAGWTPVAQAAWEDWRGSIGGLEKLGKSF